MNRYRVTLVVMLAGVAVLTSSPAGAKTSAGAAGPGGTWGKAREVAAPLGKRGAAVIQSVSCGSAGNCSAVGYYYKKPYGYTQAFVVSQVGGIWGKSEQVPGTAMFAQSGIHSVSCASAGNCSAGGYYSPSGSVAQAFVVSQVHGTWGKAEQVPGLAALNKGGWAGVLSVSCASAGNCSAGGWYTPSGSAAAASQAFVVSQVHGTWGKAERVPGLAALNTGRIAEVDSVSCAAAGNCSAGGYYYKKPSDNQYAFVVSQVGGTWGKAEQVPGTARFTQSGINSVSCAAAGNCSAGGWNNNRSRQARQQAFVVSQVHGTWGKAEEVPGTAALNAGGDAQVTSVSCAAAGNCSAAGYYLEHNHPEVQQAFVVSQVHGTWGKAEQVPGTTALNKGGNAGVTSVSCAAAGNCSAGGWYTGRSGAGQAFVVSQVGGTWGKAEEVPGSAALNQGGQAQVNSVSCASAGNCSAGGWLRDHGQQAFVVSQTRT